jgi:hypothetical protein
MSKVLIPSRGYEDWRHFLADPEKQWKHGYSAMATALSWENAHGVPFEISELLGGKAELLLAIPEHKVALPGGSRDSQCDVFALIKILNETYAVAVEAKVNEPFGPTIGEWMQNASKGKIERIHYICDLLGLSTLPPDCLRYQLFHRTSAAILEAERFKTDKAAMIIQSFSQDHKWFEDFYDFCKLLGLDVELGKGYQIKLPSQKSLILGWAVGSKEFI